MLDERRSVDERVKRYGEVSGAFGITLHEGIEQDLELIEKGFAYLFLIIQSEAEFAHFTLP